jgi:hypothetical protein
MLIHHQTTRITKVRICNLCRKQERIGAPTIEQLDDVLANEPYCTACREWTSMGAELDPIALANQMKVRETFHAATSGLA